MARKNKVNVCAVISVFMIITGIIYVITCTVLGLHNKWIFRLLFAGWVMAYMILTDFVEPVVMGRFQKKKSRQIKAYYKYAFLDIVGMAGLLWFVIMAGIFNDYTHYAGIAIFVVCYVPKNIFYKKFNARQSFYERYQDADEEDIEISDDEEKFEIDLLED